MKGERYKSYGMKGKKHSPETIEKLRLARSKRGPYSEETKKKISVANKGRVMSEESRLKMIETKRRDPRYGERAGNWKGGATRLSQLARSCFRYRQWRSDVFERDNYTCVLCGHKSNGDIEADHIKPQRSIIKENKLKTSEDISSCEELWNINNGRTLCKQCHQNTDTYRNKKTKYD